MPRTFLSTRVLFDFERYLSINPEVDNSSPLRALLEYNFCMRILPRVEMSLPQLFI